jgi:hypothetical protein
MGVRFLNRIEFRAEAEPETMPEMAALYDRVSRSVRRSIALRHHLDQAPSRTEKRTAARRKLIRTVEDAIDLRAETPNRPNASPPNSTNASTPPNSRTRPPTAPSK